MVINLYISLYLESNLGRRQEFNDCLSKNLANTKIEKIYILKEGEFILEKKSEKIVVYDVLNRPTYNTFFEIINKNTSKDDINIVANSDIYFDESIELVKKYLSDKNCFALSRWELTDPPQLFAISASQDSWIFKGPVKSNLNGNFNLGIWGCDNKIAFEISKSGYRLTNPSFSIHSYHMHFSNIRNYESNLEIKGPFSNVVPDSFDSFLKLFQSYLKEDELAVLKLKFRLRRLLKPAIRIGMKISRKLNIKIIFNRLNRLY
jgi:hypothetical protein